MEATNFIAIWHEVCNQYHKNPSCGGCPFAQVKEKNKTCIDWIMRHPIHSVLVMQQYINGVENE